jgi:signal transduction histidine kinase
MPAPEFRRRPSRGCSDPFFRVETDRGRSTGGAGLGLAIARRAVELHRGTVRAVNTHPGLRVTILL